MNEEQKAIKKLEKITNDYTLSGEDLHYAIILYHLILNLQQENNQLKEQVECLIKQRDDINKNATEHLEKNIDYTHIVKELRSWLEEKDNNGYEKLYLEDVLSKLNELEEINNEN